MLAAFMLYSLLIIQGCGGKGGDVPPPLPNPCSSKTITVSGTVTNTATGQSTGVINATGAGSTNFTYQLGTGAFQASGVFNALASGTYSITAKDADGCTGLKSFTVVDACTVKNITITETTVSAGPTTGTANGSIDAMAAGSTGFTYQLNGGVFQASAIFTGLTANTYNLTAKDADGCTKTKAVTVALDNCRGKTLGISAASTPSDKCAGTGTGSVTITGTGGAGFTYQLGTGAFQTSNTFKNVTVNTYAITVKDADGCIKSDVITVAALPAGTMFTAVQAIIKTNCAISGCHLGSGATGGLNFADDCTIVGSWERIKARAVDAPTSMPPAPRAQLSAADKQKIVDWIAAGHNNTN